MIKLVCEISQSLADALTARAAASGESTSHIVMRALADALGVDHATLFQCQPQQLWYKACIKRWSPLAI
jgi:hypothetical protein